MLHYQKVSNNMYGLHVVPESRPYIGYGDLNMAFRSSKGSVNLFLA